MLAIELNQPAHRHEVEAVLALEAQPHDVCADRLFQWPVSSGCAQIRDVSLAREAVHEIDGHALRASDIEGIHQVHYADGAHTLTSSGRRSIGRPQWRESIFRSASLRPSNE